jgi:NitT/TauT family transport system permease protein
MRLDRFTNQLQGALGDAQSLALGRDHNFILPAHLLVALIAQPGGTVRPLLAKCGVDARALSAKLDEFLARQPRVAAVFDPYVKMVNALPRVVLAPIFALWFGLGVWSKVALGVTLVFFIVFFNVYQGVKEVPATVLDNGRMLGMKERQLMRHVYWPSALSWMFSSLHTSVGFAVVGAVVGEYLGSAAGLGYLIQQAEGVFDVAGVFAGMFVLSAFVILIDMAVTAVEKRLLVWRPTAAARD